jgi:hypothetical protein
MNANANASFFGNLRGSSSKEPTANKAGRSSKVPVYEDKVRECVGGVCVCVYVCGGAEPFFPRLLRAAE